MWGDQVTGSCCSPGAQDHPLEVWQTTPRRRRQYIYLYTRRPSYISPPPFSSSSHSNVFTHNDILPTDTITIDMLAFLTLLTASTLAVMATPLKRAPQVYNIHASTTPSLVGALTHTSHLTPLTTCSEADTLLSLVQIFVVSRSIHYSRQWC